MMKRLYFAFFAAAAAVAALCVSCDEVDNADRLVYVPLPSVNRCVLLEDFTGQKCVNCPNATETIGMLQAAYGEDTVIAVAIHGGQFGLAESRGGLATDEAAAYYQRWGVDAQPAGLINRSSGILRYEEWTTAVNSQMALPTPVRIDTLVAQYNADSTKVGVDVALLSADTLNATLQLWLLEDSIVARQLLPDGKLEHNYVHNHVFRRSLNGTWGTPVALRPEQTTQHFEADLDMKYDRRHLVCVAFVYDASGVLQARRAPLR